MRTLGLLLLSLLLLVQYPLWLGKGGVLRVWELERQVDGQRAVNEQLRLRNSALAAEVQDLRVGRVAVEERARFELGMIAPGEIFVQVSEVPRPDMARAGGVQPARLAMPAGR